VAALTTLCRDETIVRWTNVPTGYTESMAKARIAEADTERQAGRALMLAVADAATDEALGACDLRIHDAGHAEIAYMLGAHARGRGVMTRAVLLISRWGNRATQHPEDRDTRPPRQPRIDRGSRTSRVSNGGRSTALPRQEGPRRGPGGVHHHRRRILNPFAMASTLKLIALVLPLGLDTFGVALALGLAGLPREKRLRISLLFAGFEAACPRSVWRSARPSDTRSDTPPTTSQPLSSPRWAYTCSSPRTTTRIVCWPSLAAERSAPSHDLHFDLVRGDRATPISQARVRSHRAAKRPGGDHRCQATHPPMARAASGIVVHTGWRIAARIEPIIARTGV